MPGTFGDANTRRLEALMVACEAPPPEPEEEPEAHNAAAVVAPPAHFTVPGPATPA
jgi:hypothetical protein